MTKKRQGKCAVFDAGKTFAKVSIVGSDGQVWAERRTATPYLNTLLYRAFDSDRLFAWLLDQLKELGQHYAIDRIMPVAHGAACAFLDEQETLIQPVQDYEARIPEPYASAYRQIRPDFSETCSPALPDGLNLGAQIHWHARRDPEAFQRVRWILPYPQYWAWRLSGVLSSEVTSLGCHTDLWSPRTGGFSSLARNEGWDGRFAPLRHAWDRLGSLRTDIAKAAGLPPNVQVCAGLHDSNAALAASLLSGGPMPAVLSTGTWFVAMAPGAPLQGLQAERDCLVAVDVFGRPVPCARFMGGRTFDVITGGHTDVPVDADSLSAIIRDGGLAMPNFVEAGGPFPGRRGEIRNLNRDTPEARAALGLLYLAMLSTECLGLIQAGDSLLVEGAAARNETLCRLIAALHDGPVLVNDGVSGVTRGAAALAFYGENDVPAVTGRRVRPMLRQEVRAYRHLWHSALGEPIAA
ncbi:MAG TPA: FGGY family carbohydrate kinase [Asticcacaulis sp.]|nr:FGGY family carbohydrate kinase [Asticcacaulis sp.]